MRLTLGEKQSLQIALADPEFRNGFLVFVSEQSKFYSEKVVSEIRKSQPDTQLAAQNAGRLDAYEHLLAELRHFVDNAE